jgi:hypothetical protein
MHHLLSIIPYQEVIPEEIKLPPKQCDQSYIRPPVTDQTFVPEIF